MRILIAKDEAFNFCYKANIDTLAQFGEISFFSPLHDDIAIDCDHLYLPGGYPELFLSKIAANATMRQRIKEYAEQGGAILAECGGFMYLCHDIDNTPMCNVFPFKATMQNAHLHLGYRQMNIATPDGDLNFRGHEFHYSEVIDCDSPSIEKICNQYSAKHTPVPTAIYRYKNVIAGYTHWYWADFLSAGKMLLPLFFHSSKKDFL